MKTMREKFEALPEIERHVKNGFIEFIGNHYFLPKHVKNDGSQAFLIHKHNVTWVNGAWYAYQEQQKIINMQECGAAEIQMILDDTEYDDATKLERIKELLK